MHDEAERDQQAAEDRKRNAQQVRDDWRWLMSQETGRRLVWRLLHDAGVFRSTFSESPTVAAFAEGRRNFGLQLYEQALADHEPYALMQRENQTQA